MIQRFADQQLKNLAAQFRVVALTGPRQAGKTTLLKSFFADYQYFNLENLATYDFVQANPMTFARDNSRAVIDEIQRLPELLPALQVVVDERNQTGDFVISGSQNLLQADKASSEKASQSLAGRAAYQLLLPLSIDELKAAGLLKTNYFQQMFYGFYPALYDNPTLTPYDYYDNYVATYVERDLRNIKNIQDLTQFRKFMGLVAGRIGQLVNYDSLASDVGVSAKTIEDWLSILEASYIIFTLPPYHANINRRLVKSPKIYFYDVGLASHLLGIDSPEALETHFLRGGLFENMIIADIVKYTANNAGLRDKLSFYRDSNGNEIDLLIETAPGELLPLEIKSADRVRSDYQKGLLAFSSLLNDVVTVRDGRVIYSGDFTSLADSGIGFVNWQEVGRALG